MRNAPVPVKLSQLLRSVQVGQTVSCTRFISWRVTTQLNSRYKNKRHSRAACSTCIRGSFIATQAKTVFFGRCDENYIHLLRWSISISIFPQSVFSPSHCYHSHPGQAQVAHFTLSETLQTWYNTAKVHILPGAFSPHYKYWLTVQRLVFISERKVIIALHFVLDLLMS